MPVPAAQLIMFEKSLNKDENNSHSSGFKIPGSKYEMEGQVSHTQVLQQKKEKLTRAFVMI